MAKQTVGLGSVANDGTGDDLRTGGDKINDNFNEIYTALGDGSALDAALEPYTTTEKNKLSGIEASADVTDTTNVTAAGAVMDSEVTNLAAVKAFDPADYATAAQGSTADTATQPGDSWATLDGTAWRVAYTNGTGDVTELALGADGTFLKSNGAAAAPSFATPAGSGDVSKVGTPVNNQVAVWTGDGTLEGIAALTYDATNFVISADLDPNADGTINLGNATNRFASISVDSIDLNGTTFTGTTLTDPNADAFLGWDDSAGETIFFTIGNGLTAATTTISADVESVAGETGAITAADLRTALNVDIAIPVAISDETTALTTGTGKLTYYMPRAFTLTGIHACVTTAPVGSSLIIDVNDGGTSIMTTNKLEIDAGENDTTTAATAPTLTDTALAAGAAITFDIDQVGSSTAGAGAKVTLMGYWT